MNKEATAVDVTNEFKGKSNKRRNISIGILIILLILGTGGGIFWWYTLKTTISTNNAKVTGDIIDISFRTSGQLQTIHVKEGDHVEQGQILADLYSKPYQIILDQARAGLAVAEVNSAKFPYDLQSMEASIRKAEAGVSSASSSLKSAETSLEDARRYLEKQELLFASSAISEEQLNQARSNNIRAQAAADAAQAGVQSANETLKDSQQKLQAANETTPALLEAQLSAAQASFASAELNLANTVIKAPTSGSILRIAAAVGENISSGQTVVTIADLNTTWIQTNIEENKIARLKIGQKVDVKIDAYPGQILNGQVTSIGSAAQSTFSLISSESTSGNYTKVAQRLPVKIEIKDPGMILKPGMSAVIKIYIN